MTSALTLGPAGTRYGGKIVITGLDNLHANLRRIAVQYPEELGYALKQEAYAVMEESLKLCPYDQDNPHDDGTPHLNETADVIGPEITGGNITVFMIYDTPYAVEQHEVASYHHDYPEQWKYLESPLLTRAKFIPTNLMRAVNLERLGQGYAATSIEQLQRGYMTRGAKQRYEHLLGRFV